MKLLISLTIFLSLSSCQHLNQLPKIDPIDRCLLFKNEQGVLKLTCQIYKLDVKGGEVIEDAEPQEIPNKMICFDLDNWEYLTNKRDEFILWGDDMKCRARK